MREGPISSTGKGVGQGVMRGANIGGSGWSICVKWGGVTRDGWQHLCVSDIKFAPRKRAGAMINLRARCPPYIGLRARSLRYLECSDVRRQRRVEDGVWG